MCIRACYVGFFMRAEGTLPYRVYFLQRLRQPQPVPFWLPRSFPHGRIRWFFEARIDFLFAKSEFK